MRYDWSDGAPCEGRTDLFFTSDDETQRSRSRRERAAKTLCAQCHCIERCRDEALRRKEQGIWGGMTENERRATPISTSTAQIRIVPAPRRDPEVDTSDWRVIERRLDTRGREIRLSICESGATWHGFEFAVHRADERVFLADNEPDAWLYFHSLVMS